MSSDLAIESERATQPTSISLEAPLLEAGKLMAKKKRQSFSAYVATLVEQDLAKAASEKEVAP